MSEERKRIDFSGFSEKLHLFICPLFTPNPANRLGIPTLVDRKKPGGTDDSVDKRSVMDNPSVRLDVNTPQAVRDRLPVYQQMANDLIEDFNLFLTQLAESLRTGWNLDSLHEDIASGISRNRFLFSDDPCWFHISHPENGIVLDFTKRFLRMEDHPGIVFGYYHEWEDYTDSWGDQDPRSKALTEKTKEEEITDDRVNDLIQTLADSIDTSGLPEPPQTQPIQSAETDGDDDTSRIVNIEWTPSLEVSLRIPIRKPSDAEGGSFEAELEAIRDRLKQKSVGIFDEENMKMYYLESDGWTEGPSKFVKVALGPKAPQKDHPEFLTRVKNAVKESATITNPQSPSVFTNRNEGKIIPANAAYLYDLLNQTHLGFSFFPIAQATQTDLTDICLLDKGRWLWDSVFPYKMNGVERAMSSHDLFPPLVLLDVHETQCAVYAPYVPGSKCLCGRNYPDPDLECPQNASLPVGELRCECPASRHPGVNAGDPHAVLQARHGNPQEAGKAWDGALKRIS